MKTDFGVRFYRCDLVYAFSVQKNLLGHPGDESVDGGIKNPVFVLIYKYRRPVSDILCVATTNLKVASFENLTHGSI